MCGVKKRLDFSRPLALIDSYDKVLSAIGFVNNDLCSRLDCCRVIRHATNGKGLSLAIRERSSKAQRSVAGPRLVPSCFVGFFVLPARISD